MRWIVLSLFLAVAAAAGSFHYLRKEAARLESYCAGVAPGMPVRAVRKQARKEGFRVTMDPYSQMRIEIPYSPVAPATCRIFLNAGRTVEYRRFQASAGS